VNKKSLLNGCRPFGQAGAATDEDTTIVAAVKGKNRGKAWLRLCKADKSWRTLETTAGHDVMVDAPEWLADIMLQVS